MWTVVLLDEVAEWLDSLDSKTESSVRSAIAYLEREGPNLGRPLVDRVQGSLLTNLKELRPVGSHGRQVIRLLFVFDPQRQAVILVGGDKRGDWRGWYREAIEIAEFRFVKYLDRR